METFQTAIKKILPALNQLGVREKQGKVVQNYITNLIITVISDPELKKRLTTGELEKIITEIKEL